MRWRQSERKRTLDDLEPFHRIPNFSRICRPIPFRSRPVTHDVIPFHLACCWLVAGAVQSEGVSPSKVVNPQQQHFFGGHLYFQPASTSTRKLTLSHDKTPFLFKRRDATEMFFTPPWHQRRKGRRSLVVAFMLLGLVVATSFFLSFFSLA